MMTDNELDNLLSDFLTDTKTDNNDQFVQSVMSSLPPEPKFAWVRDIFPAIAFFITMMTLWKFKLLTPAVVLALSSKGLAYLQTQWMTLNPMTGMAVLIVVFLMICHYAYETFVEI